ncbi:MAG: hypothetical protein H6555_11535 [Lewinellaceae bacterium]|nr:hypothetical protein [Lewinellaceae bacterium]
MQSCYLFFTSRWPLLGLVLLFPLFLAGQRPDTLPTDPNAFIGVLGEQLLATGNKELEEIFKTFEQQFRSGYFAEGERDQVISSLQKMWLKRLSPNPQMRDYLALLTQMKQVAEPERRFREWHKMLDTLLAPQEEQRVNNVATFLDFAAGWFTDQRLRPSDSGTNWLVRASDYSLAYVDKKPQVVIPLADLVARRKTDSIRIVETSGIFNIFDNQWEGKGGRVTWERLGMDPNIYAELGAYELDVRRGLYESNQANLHYPLFFGERKVPGVFSDKISVYVDSTTASFPRFQSAETDLSITKFGEGIRYQGGFRMEGATIIGLGVTGIPARIDLVNNRGQRVYSGRADKLIIRREEVIIGQGVESTFYFKTDSIYHPSVNLRYNIPKRELLLVRGQRGSDRNLFFSSAHKMNIDAEQLLAFIDRDSVLIGKPTISIANKPPVRFESFDYFNQREYEQLQSISNVNPVGAIKFQAEKSGRRILPADEIARIINPRFGVENIVTLLYDLVGKGFINYDPEKQLIEVKDKVFRYANAASNKEDYDRLRINSDTDSTNAVMNLRNNTINVKGVKFLEVSNRQRVAIIPDTGQLILGANRNMDFTGRLRAGYSELAGKDFHFDYDKFQFQLDSIDRWRLFLPDKRPSETKEVNALALTSDLEHFTGILLVDAPNNKSGREDIAIFPSLTTKSKAYVYYDGEFAKDTVYLRDSFYYEVEPFGFNRLDDYIREDVQFKGKLVSAGIFPDFKENLIIRPEDYSLGFIHQTPKTGYPVYHKRGVFSGEVDLTNRGLWGKGNLKYLGASINSEDFVFRPASVKSSAEFFELDEERGDPEVPQVSGTKVAITWNPYQDSMYVKPLDAPFALYKAGEHTFDGTLILTPGGLKGAGLLDWPQASLQSDYFAFGAFSAAGDTTELKIKTEDNKSIAIQTANIYGAVDFDKMIGNFKANEEFLKTKLPFNQYETSMNEFDWDMKKSTIDFKADPTKMGTFTSLAPTQDSLNFRGRTAFYDLKTHLLQIGEVPFIKSADAFIYPDSGKVEVKAGGVMTTLENATIICDTINQNHKILRAAVDIKGRKDYLAKGFYEYNIGERQQEIEFSNVVGQRVGKGAASEKRTATRANGEVTEADSFFIDKKTAFYGTIKLSSESVNLQFDGYARLEADRLPERNWFNINCEGDKSNLAIKYNNPKTFDGVPLETGIFLSKETTAMYPRIMMPLFFRKDRPILPAKGVFRYDKPKDQFIFGDSTKVLHNDYRGAEIVFDNKTGKVTGDGRLNLGSGLKYVSLDAAGSLQTGFRPPLPDTVLIDTLPPLPVDIDIVSGLQLVVPDKLLRIMLNEIEAASFGSAPITYLSDIDYYKRRFTMLLPPSKELDNALNTLTTGVFELPKSLNTYTFLFSGLKMRWDMDYQSFVNTKTDVGLVSIAGEPVNKVLQTYVEYKMPTNEDDRVYVYFKLPNDIFYYFGYRQGFLELTSNDNRFMEELSKMKSSELVVKMKDGETYEIQVVEQNRAQMFVRRAQAAGK